MKKTDTKYQAFIQILREELIPAMGCTEPIALAYAAAIARDLILIAYQNGDRSSGSASFKDTG